MAQKYIGTFKARDLNVQGAKLHRGTPSIWITPTRAGCLKEGDVPNMPGEYIGRWREARDKAAIIKSAKKVKCGSSAKIPLFDHQQKALAFVLSIPRSGLLAAPGLGKTRVALESICVRLKHGKIKRALIVAPKSVLKESWYKDLKKFTDLEAIIAHPQAGIYRWRCPLCPPGSPTYTKLTRAHALKHAQEIFELTGKSLKKDIEASDLAHWAPPEVRWADFEDAKAAIESDYSVVITTPEHVKKLEKEIAASGFDYIIVDEATCLKNSSSKTHKVHADLADYTPYFLALTGTPLTNRIEDLFGVMRCINGELGSTITGFRERFMYPHPKFPDTYLPRAGAIDQILELIAPDVLRLRREDCLDLPPRHVVEVHCELSAAQERHYDSMRDELFAVLQDKEIVAKNPGVQLGKLQQITQGFIMESKTETKLVIDACPPKIERLKAILNDAEGKTIVWAKYKHDHEVLLKELASWGVVNINGGTTSKQLELNVERFRDDPSCQVLVAQPASAKFGHTWTWATTSVFYSHSWELENYIQARDRNYRIGQTSPVTEFLLIGSGIDQIMVDRIKKLDNRALTTLNRDELMGVMAQL